MNCFDMNAYTFLLIFLINDQKTSQKKFLVQNDFSLTMRNDFLCQTTGCHYSCLLPQFLFDPVNNSIQSCCIAVKNPERFCHWLQTYGSEKIILGADVKDHKIAVNGWKDESACELFPFLKDYVEKGIRKVICTDINCDGMLQGPSTALYKEILEANSGLYLIASGGVSCVDDIRKLEAAGVPAVIFGKALYEGRITFKELEGFMI